ncbi:MAG: hypothetical protein ACI92I_000865 [Acidimicrobiales bacterium]|jgi:hypothetical protein
MSDSFPPSILKATFDKVAITPLIFAYGEDDTILTTPHENGELPIRALQLVAEGRTYVLHGIGQQCVIADLTQKKDQQLIGNFWLFDNKDFIAWHMEPVGVGEFVCAKQEIEYPLDVSVVGLCDLIFDPTNDLSATLRQISSLWINNAPVLVPPAHRVDTMIVEGSGRFKTLPAIMERFLNGDVQTDGYVVEEAVIGAGVPYQNVVLV